MLVNMQQSKPYIASHVNQTTDRNDKAPVAIALQLVRAPILAIFDDCKRLSFLFYHLSFSKVLLYCQISPGRYLLTECGCLINHLKFIIEFLVLMFLHINNLSINSVVFNYMLNATQYVKPDYWFYGKNVVAHWN